MRVVSADRENVVVALPRDQLVLLGNALAYVCHGAALPDFETLMGATHPEAEALLDTLDRLIKGQSTPVK